MAYAVYRTKTFDKELEKMPKDFIQWVDKMEDQMVVYDCVDACIILEGLLVRKMQKLVKILPEG